MTPSSSGPVLPSWVRKRDGRLVPFESDRVSRALFAATETTGKPDAFLARELTDVAVHFLAEETEGTTPTTEQIKEILVKVLRELKQSALAAAFVDGAARQAKVAAKDQDWLQTLNDEALAESSDEVRRASLRRYSLQAIFGRDLASAHQNGILHFCGLEAPEELHAVAVAPVRGHEELLPRLEKAAQLGGVTVGLDALEAILDAELAAGRTDVSRQRMEQLARDYIERLALGLRLTNRKAVLALNNPPTERAEGATAAPLFGDQLATASPEQRILTSEVLLEAFLTTPALAERIRLEWRWSEMGAPLTLARAVLVGLPLHIVFPRPRQPVSLGEGLTRGHPAVLLSVGVNLLRLARLVCEELPAVPAAEHGLPMTVRAESFLTKLPSLVRLALSAASRKREYLRKRSPAHAALSRGFLLDRGRLVVAPLDLEDTVRLLCGSSMCAEESSLQFGARVLTRLREVLRDEGRALLLETTIDALPDVESSGPTCWDRAAPIKTQLKTLGVLHQAAGGGTGTVFLSQDEPTSAEQIVELLQWARQQTSIHRLRVVVGRPPLHQATFPDL